MSAVVDMVECVAPVETSSTWTFEENKTFEVLLARHFQDSDRWNKLATSLPSKSHHDLQHRFQLLEDDLKRIADGKVQLPQYLPGDVSDDAAPSKKNKLEAAANGERRKGVPWTEEEHRLFLLGLSKHGKGDWRSIARNYVVSRTPTQVASHAQKYFIRLNTMTKKDKRRASIHDITSAGSVMGQVAHGQAPAGALPTPGAGAGHPGGPGGAGAGGGMGVNAVGSKGGAGGRSAKAAPGPANVSGPGVSGVLPGMSMAQPHMLLPLPFAMALQMPRSGGAPFMPHM